MKRATLLNKQKSFLPQMLCAYGNSPKTKEEAPEIKRILFTENI